VGNVYLSVDSINCLHMFW